MATLASGNYLLSGFVGGDGATVTKSAGSYDNSNVGTGKTVTVGALTSTDYAANGSTLLSNYVLPTTVSGAVGSITQLASVSYIGAAGGNWSLASNWAGGAIPTLGNVATVVIPAGSGVVFDDANLASLTPTSAINNSGTLGFANSAALSFANTVSGPGMLSKAGPGTLSLSGPNTHSGNTVVAGGTLAITGAGSLGGGNYAGSISLAAGTTLAYASSADQTISGTVSGAGSLSQAGGGALTLSGANTYDGSTTISAGVLRAANSSALGSTVGGTTGASG